MKLRGVLCCLWAVTVFGCGQEQQAPNEPSPVAAASSESSGPGYLGVQLVDPQAVPLVISGFVPGSPAERSGLQSGDAILRVHREWDPDGEQLMETLQSFQPGQFVGVRVMRGEEELEYRVGLISAETVESSMERATP